MAAPLPRLMLLASPDEFLVELERGDFAAAWREAHPDGEVLEFEGAPPASRLLGELASPSLFSPQRLLVVAAAATYLTGAEQPEGEMLAGALGSLPLSDVTLLLAAVVKTAPGGAVAEAVAARGEVRYLPLPEAPKPWEDVRVSRSQRAVLASLVARVAPPLAAEHEVVDALIEAHGFRPRELAKAAERLLLSGEVTAAAVREQAGVGECTLRELEEAVLHRDAPGFAAFAGRLASGGALTDWWGHGVAPDRVAIVLAGTLGRLLRQALAARAHAVRASLAGELQPARCEGGGWYNRTFKPKLLPALAADIEATTASPLAGLSPWQLHRAFRLGAAYSEGELVTALAALARSGAERERGPAALSALSAVALAFIPRGGG